MWVRGGFPGHPPSPKSGPGGKARPCGNRLVAHGPARGGPPRFRSHLGGRGQPAVPVNKGGGAGPAARSKMEGAGDCDRRPPAPPRPALRGRFRRLTCSDSASWAEGWRAPRLSGPPGAGAGERTGLRVAAPHRPPTLRRGAARGPERAPRPSHPPDNLVGGPERAPASGEGHRFRARAGPRPLSLSG